MLDAFLDLFAPECCVGCRARGALLCSGCARGLSPPLRSVVVPGCSSVAAVWAYEGAARDLVLALKIRSRIGAARPLGEAIGRSIGRNGSPARVVTWIPARRRDITERGFDHAEAIARHAARTLGVPAVRLVTWASERGDQAALDRAQRRRNVLGAFRSGRVEVPVLVVDDIVTTGATLAAAACALAAAGAPRVDAAVACRA